MRLVTKIEPASLYNDGTQFVKLSDGSYLIAQDDYFESGGICYSRIHLTRSDIESILRETDHATPSA